MATSLAATIARRAATLARLSSPATPAAFLVSRRGLSDAAGPPKVRIWNKPVPAMKDPLPHFVLMGSFLVVLTILISDNYIDLDEARNDLTFVPMYGLSIPRGKQKDIQVPEKKKERKRNDP